MATTTEPHGKVSYRDGILTITTMAKRGNKMVPNVVKYAVLVEHGSDPRVAKPVYRLTKEDGTVYHVAVTEHGPACSCAHATFRGANSKVPCKHIASCVAMGWMNNTNEDADDNDQERT